MEKTDNSEKVPFLKIIELLRSENSFLSSENEILKKQIELYRSEIKVNEQRNAAYRKKADHLIKLISDLPEEYGKVDTPDENEVQNITGSSSKESSRSSQNEHELVINDNDEDSDADKLQNNEHEQHRDENVQQIDEHELQNEENELKRDEHEQQRNEHKDSSKDTLTHRNGNEDQIITSRQYQKENDSLNTDDEEVDGWKMTPIRSKVIGVNDNVKQINDNEETLGSELNVENGNETLKNDNVNINNEDVTVKKSKIEASNENINTGNRNEAVSGSRMKIENDNEQVHKITVNEDEVRKRQYKVLMEIIKNNMKVTFSRKYIKKMMDRYANEMIYIINNDKVGLREICTATGASVSTMIRDLSIFKRKGWIKYHGTAKFGFYRVTEEGRQLTIEKAII